MKNDHKYGTLHYLAQWQGLREEDLDINLSKEYKLICSKMETEVILTNNSEGVSNPQKK